MEQGFTWHSGMSVDLIMAPGDIRNTSIRKAEETKITLRQTVPPLEHAFLNRTILLTFKAKGGAERIGCKAKVARIDSGGDEALIVIEKGEEIAAYDLRKFPRFNPGLFDDVRILYGHTALEVTDISAGGARGVYKNGDLGHLSRGDVIRLTLGIGPDHHHVEAQIMRINHAIDKGGHWELAFAFVTWDRPFDHILAKPDKA